MKKQKRRLTSKAQQRGMTSQKAKDGLGTRKVNRDKGYLEEAKKNVSGFIAKGTFAKKVIGKNTYLTFKLKKGTVQLFKISKTFTVEHGKNLFRTALILHELQSLIEAQGSFSEIFEDVLHSRSIDESLLMFHHDPSKLKADKLVILNKLTDEIVNNPSIEPILELVLRLINSEDANKIRRLHSLVKEEFTRDLKSIHGFRKVLVDNKEHIVGKGPFHDLIRELWVKGAFSPETALSSSEIRPVVLAKARSIHDFIRNDPSSFLANEVIFIDFTRKRYFLNPAAVFQ